MKEKHNLVTKFYYRGRTFYICTWTGELPQMTGEQTRYVAIEDKYVDENGCLTQTLNGFQMHAEDTAQKCMESVKFSVDVHCRMEETGEDIETALYHYMKEKKEI